MSVQPNYFTYSRGVAMVGVMQINQIQIHGQPVTENSVESDQYSLVSNCCEKTILCSGPWKQPLESTWPFKAK
jgi:hypothetical protein